MLTFLDSSDCSTAIGRVILMPDKGVRDKTWDYAKPCMMHIIEVSTGIVCTCLPTMRISIKEAFSRGCFSFCGWRSNKTNMNDDGKFWPRRLARINSIPSQKGERVKRMEFGEHSESNLACTDLGWRPGGCRTEISRCSAGEFGNICCDESEARRILVTEQIDIELRAVDRAVIRERVRSEC